MYIVSYTRNGLTTQAQDGPSPDERPWRRGGHGLALGCCHRLPHSTGRPSESRNPTEQAGRAGRGRGPGDAAGSPSPGPPGPCGPCTESVCHAHTTPDRNERPGAARTPVTMSGRPHEPPLWLAREHKGILERKCGFQIRHELDLEFRAGHEPAPSTGSAGTPGAGPDGKRPAHARGAGPASTRAPPALW